MDRKAEESLQEHFGMTFSQFRMLMVIEKHKLPCQAEIAKFHGLTPAAVSRQIELLTEKKLIKAIPNTENRRENILSLTPEGKKITKQALTLLDKIFEKMYHILTPTEQASLSANLEKLYNNLCSGKTKENH